MIPTPPLGYNKLNLHKAPPFLHRNSLRFSTGIYICAVTLARNKKASKKNANNLYYGTITFQSPDSGSKTKTKIADDLFELYGERMNDCFASKTRPQKDTK